MSEVDLVAELIEALRCLPGVGPKSAQRMTFHLLERDREGARRLARALAAASDGVGNCRQCRTLTSASLCPQCADPRRDRSVLCVVESPADLMAIERATGYRGAFFVLMGHLSPLDGIGPEQLGLDELDRRLAAGEVKEVILATGGTVEGQATAHYVGEMARRHGARATRLAQGIPLGGELEFVDGGTLAQALSDRRDLG